MNEKVFNELQKIKQNNYHKLHRTMNRKNWGLIVQQNMKQVPN